MLPKYFFSVKEFKRMAEESVEILTTTTLQLVQALVHAACSLGAGVSKDFGHCGHGHCVC